MRRILLQYLGRKVIDSEVKFEYSQRLIYPTKSNQSKISKKFHFDKLLFPYNVVGSLVIGPKKGSQIIMPFINSQGQEVQTFDLFPNKSKKRKIRLNRKVFVLIDHHGKYALTDPLTNKIITTKEIELLQIWDIYFPMMEDYFNNSEHYQKFQLKYLTKSEIKKLKI